MGSPWNYTGHGGESELVERLLPGGSPEDLQPLANCGLDVLVFHNEYRTLPVVSAYRVTVYRNDTRPSLTHARLPALRLAAFPLASGYLWHGWVWLAPVLG